MSMRQAAVAIDALHHS